MQDKYLTWHTKKVIGNSNKHLEKVTKFDTSPPMPVVCQKAFNSISLSQDLQS